MRSLLRAVLAVAVVATMLGLTTGVAAADDFNPFSDSGVRKYTAFGDCTITVGPVRDPQGGTQQGTFQVIGGVHVACKTRHHIRVYVAENFRPSYREQWKQIGQTQVAQYHNMLTFGAHIDQSLPLCGQGGPLYGQFFTSGWVYETDRNDNLRTGVTVASEAKTATARAC